MNDNQIIKLVRDLETHIKNKSYDSEHSAVAAALIILAKGCYDSNAGEMEITLYDCEFENVLEKSNYRIHIKKI